MKPPFTEFQDRSDYKRRMNDLLKIDPKRTAVLTVDMQNDYLDMNLATAPCSPEEAKRVVTGAKKLLTWARSIGIPVVHAYVKRRKLEVSRCVVHNAFIDATI